MSDLNIEDDFQADIEKIKELLNQKFWEGAQEIVELIKDEAPIDTGSLVDAVYANDSHGNSTYDEAVSAATSHGKEVVIVPEEEPMQFQENFETNVGVAVKHGYMVENGFSPTGPRPPNAFFSRGTASAEDVFDKKASEAMEE